MVSPKSLTKGSGRTKGQSGQNNVMKRKREQDTEEVFILSHMCKWNIIIHRNSKYSLCLFYLNDLILKPFTLLLDSSLKEGQRSGWKSSWCKDQSMVARR